MSTAAHNITAPRWYRSAEARGLIADCARKLPAHREVAAPAAVWLNGGPDTVIQYDRNDERVERLGKIADAEFGRFERDYGREGAIHFVENTPRVDDLIDAARRALMMGKAA